MTKSQIRRELKQNAKQQLLSNARIIILATILVGILADIPNFLGGYLLNDSTYINYLNIASFLIGAPLRIGLIMLILNFSRGGEGQLKDISKGFKRIYQIYSTSLIKFIATFVLTLPFTLIPLFLIDDVNQGIFTSSLITVISSTVFMIIFSQVEYVIADNEGICPIEAVKKSISMLKGHVGEYIFLNLSFFGWILLVGMTAGIAYFWVGPYMEITFVNFYEYIKEDKLKEYKKSKNSSTVMGLIIGALLCGYILVESEVTEYLLTPQIVKTVVNENNLDLVNSYYEDNYYISEDESKVYDIDINYGSNHKLTKYTLVVQNHPLDAASNDDIHNTIVYVLASGDEILGISCDVVDETTMIEVANPSPGKYDINGKEINIK